MIPGSTPWLMAHELRLAWRLGEDKNRWVRILLLGALLLMMSAAGWPIGHVLREHHPSTTGFGALIAAMGFLFVTFMGFMTALSFIAASFVDRGDIDLLLGSPLPRRRLLTVRLAAAGVRSMTLWLFLFSPPVLMVSAIAGPRWLGGLALLADAGLVGTAAASWVILGLFRLLGARRGRTAATIASSLSGLTVGLVSGFSGSLMPAGSPAAAHLHASLNATSFNGLAALPVRILMGDGIAMTLLGAGSLALFLGSAWLLAPWFSIVSTRDDGQSRPSAGAAPLRGFGGKPFALLLIKDYRLLLRNHALMLQILGRSLAFVPLLAINLTQNRHSADLATVALAGTLVLGQTAGSLVWAFVSAETQPDLLASSPLPPGLAVRSRLCASLLPAFALVLLGAALAAARAPLAGISILTMGLGACLSSAAINTNAKASGRRSTLSNAPRPAPAAVFADMICAGMWGGGAFLLARGSIWCAVPVWLALSIVFLWREIMRRSD